MTERDSMEERVLQERLLQERLLLDARPGPAARISKDRASAMVDAALDAALADMMKPGADMMKPGLDVTQPVQPMQAPAALSELAQPTRGIGALLQHPAARALLIAAAALLMLVGGAAAAKLALHTFFTDDHAPAKAPDALKAPQAAPARTATPTNEVAPAEEAAELEPALLEAEAAPERAQRDLRVRDARETAAEEDLLQRANRARAAGRFRDAAETYALVYERHGKTLSAYVAAVAAGSIELEHLDSPTRAAKLFRRALRARPNGALDLEARQGLALALHDMGATREEIAALRSLIGAHPDRPAAARARARLEELNAAP
jgi:tetratricopeptide (TPR) repeat protein